MILRSPSTVPAHQGSLSRFARSSNEHDDSSSHHNSSYGRREGPAAMGSDTDCRVADLGTVGLTVRNGHEESQDS